MLNIVDSGLGATVATRRVVEEFVATAAITAGDLVMLDTGKTGADRVLYVKQATAAAGSLVVGFALTSASAAEARVQVLRRGYMEGAKVASGVTSGQSLYGSATVGQAGSFGSYVNVSAEITGDGTAQSTAHTLGTIPDLVFAIPSNLTGGACVVTYGTHTSTNSIATVTTGEKYKLVSVALERKSVGIALEASALANTCDIFVDCL